MKIVFLLHNAYAIGGTVRTTFNLAGTFAERHDVEIVSIMRSRTVPHFLLDPRVRLVPLVDQRTAAADHELAEYSQPAQDFPTEDKRHAQYNRLVDLRVREYLAGCDADVVIGTRPGINVYLALFGPRRVLRVAQEHLRHDGHNKPLRKLLAQRYRTMDAVVTTTRADAAAYRARMRLPGVRITSVPNIVPDPCVTPSDGTAKIIAAAGRLAPGKRFDLLLEAFAQVVVKEPDWRLRIYGTGGQQERLESLIDSLGLAGQAVLMGPHSPIEPEFAKASLVVSASDAESFGMTLVEAMRCGVPVVSTDCPLGPREIVNDGVDGRLVPVGDATALADVLVELIEDEPGRRAMGRAALESARRFDPAPVLDRYELLFEELRSTRYRRARERLQARIVASARRRWRTGGRRLRGLLQGPRSN